MQRSANAFDLLHNRIAFASSFALAVFIFHKSASFYTRACVLQYLGKNLGLVIPGVMVNKI